MKFNIVKKIFLKPQMTFGKYRNVEIECITDLDYLKWCLAVH